MVKDIVAVMVTKEHRKPKKDSTEDIIQQISYSPLSVKHAHKFYKI